MNFLEFIFKSEPGTYSFLVTFNYLNYDYIGVSTANVTVSDGNTQAVNISFSPVIGDANLEYTISNLSTLLFDYDTSLLTDVSIPKIFIVLNCGSAYLHFLRI